MIRTFAHSNCTELAEAADVPVINGLTDLTHPCQMMGDILTCVERGKDLDSMVVAFVGDGNNVANSWVNAAGNSALRAPHRGSVRLRAGRGAARGGAREGGEGHRAQTTPCRGGRRARTSSTRTCGRAWGRRSEAAERERPFRPYQVNDELLSHAAANAIVLHCLPAHRGDEITDDVMDGPRSAVFDQAENRLHAQKAVMVELMGDR